MRCRVRGRQARAMASRLRSADTRACSAELKFRELSTGDFVRFTRVGGESERGTCLSREDTWESSVKNLILALSVLSLGAPLYASAALADPYDHKHDNDNDHRNDNDH